MPSLIETFFREISEEVGWKDKFGGCIKQTRQTDARGGTTGHGAKSEGDTYRG